MSNTLLCDDTSHPHHIAITIPHAGNWRQHQAPRVRAELKLERLERKLLNAYTTYYETYKPLSPLTLAGMIHEAIPKQLRRTCGVTFDTCVIISKKLLAQQTASHAQFDVFYRNVCNEIQELLSQGLRGLFV